MDKLQIGPGFLSTSWFQPVKSIESIATSLLNHKLGKIRNSTNLMHNIEYLADFHKQAVPHAHCRHCDMRVLLNHFQVKFAMRPLR